jgi:hypothetical protein
MWNWKWPKRWEKSRCCTWTIFTNTTWRTNWRRNEAGIAKGAGGGKLTLQQKGSGQPFAGTPLLSHASKGRHSSKPHLSTAGSGSNWYVMADVECLGEIPPERMRTCLQNVRQLHGLERSTVVKPFLRSSFLHSRRVLNLQGSIALPVLIFSFTARRTIPVEGLGMRSL